MMLSLLLTISVSFAINLDCEMEWKKIFASQYTPGMPAYYSRMYMYSGFSFNNLGNFDSCNEIPESLYVLEYYSESPVIIVALCGPKVCTESDYLENPMPGQPQKIFSGYSVVFPTKYQVQRYSTFNSGSIGLIIFIGILSGLAILSSISDYFISKESKNSFLVKYLLCFSILTNGKKLLITRTQERLGQSDNLEMLSAIRVMSIGWVILGHTFNSYGESSVNSNFDGVLDLFKESKYILIYGSFYAVDTFFWISGLLMSYLFITEVNKSKDFSSRNLVLIYLHRYLRITPVFMFCMLFFWCITVYIGSGPIWTDLGLRIGNCEDYWYTNLIYLSNFLPDWKTNDCMSVGWYLCNDMQFFIISPFIILIYLKISRALGWIIVLALCVLNITSSALVAHHYNLNPSTLATENADDYNDYYYRKPYCRIAPYALGIACGFILYTYRRYQNTQVIYDKFSLTIAKLQENWYVRASTFLCGLILVNVMIFVLYDTYKYPGERYEYNSWSHAQNYAYIAMERTVFGLGLSCMFLPMLLGHFRPLTRFLSLYPWSVLARFTFVIYMIHDYIILIIIKSQKTVTVVSEYTIIRDTVYVFILSLLFSIPIVLLIEMPAANIEKIIFARYSYGQIESKESFLIKTQEHQGKNTISKPSLRLN